MKPIARTKSFLVQQVGAELILLDQSTNRAHRLNPAAALIWRNCNGQNSVTMLSKLVEQELHMKDSGEQLTLAALKELEKLELIEPATAIRQRKKITRRELGVRLAMATAALPLIVSITVPTPAQAASAGQGQGFCPPGTVPGSKACPNG